MKLYDVACLSESANLKLARPGRSHINLKLANVIHDVLSVELECSTVSMSWLEVSPESKNVDVNFSIN